MAGAHSQRLYRVLLDDASVTANSLPDAVADQVPPNAVKLVGAIRCRRSATSSSTRRRCWRGCWPPSAHRPGSSPCSCRSGMPARCCLRCSPHRGVRRLRVRKWVWVAGALLQAASVLAMALATATLDGAAAGGGILGALTAFALARSLSSFAPKDVLGRTLPKGNRGQINGLATTGAGLAAVTVGAPPPSSRGSRMQRCCTRRPISCWPSPTRGHAWPQDLRRGSRRGQHPHRLHRGVQLRDGADPAAHRGRDRGTCSARAPGRPAVPELPGGRRSARERVAARSQPASGSPQRAGCLTTRPARAESTHSASVPRLTRTPRLDGPYQAHFAEFVIALRTCGARMEVT